MGIEVDVIAREEPDRELRAHLTVLAREAAGAVLHAEGYARDDVEVSVLFTDDAFISELNLQYRGVQGPTDVLSFALMDPDDDLAKVEGLPEVLGDVIVSVETARRQAAADEKTLEQEVSLLLVHGTLHLLGYDHDEPERGAVMWKRQEEILNRLGRA